VTGSKYLSYFRGCVNLPSFPLGKKLDITTSRHIFHRLAKDSVVHQLKQVFLELILRFLSFGGVEVDVGFQPGLLTELQRTVDLGDAKTVIDGLLQVSVVDLVPVLMVEGGEELRLLGSCQRRKEMSNASFTIIEMEQKNGYIPGGARFSGHMGRSLWISWRFLG